MLKRPADPEEKVGDSAEAQAVDVRQRKVGYEGVIEHSERDESGELKKGGRRRQRNVHDAIGIRGDEVVARPNEVAAAGFNVIVAHVRNPAQVAKQARRRVGR